MISVNSISVARGAKPVIKDFSAEFKAGTITAIIGPSICGPCYEVSQEIHDEVVALHPAAVAVTPQGTPALDLPAALRAVLESAGIPILDESRCTLENTDLYSYRRDGITGRQAGIISL